MATSKPRPASVIEARGKYEPPLHLFERALKGSTNDEALEVVLRMLESLAERAEAAADIAISSDDRDIENEALAFAQSVDDIIGAFHKSSRARTCGDIVDAAVRDLRVAAQNRRSRVDGNWTKLEAFSYRRKRRIESAFAVEAARERRERDALIERADITPERVLEAMRRALVECSEVRAKDVAVALLPELADTAVVGRQTVVNRVSQVMRKLVAQGAVVQHRPSGSPGDLGRRTCTYVVNEDGDA